MFLSFKLEGIPVVTEFSKSDASISVSKSFTARESNVSANCKILGFCSQLIAAHSDSAKHP
jgi:hypothetical protein